MEEIDRLLNNVSPLEDNQGAYAGLLGDLQCGILTGHRKSRARYFFIRFRGDAASLRGFALPESLKDFRPISEWAHRQALSNHAEPGRFGVTLMLSAKGYEKLGLAAPGDPAFQAGMAKRGERLNDSPQDAWQPEYRGEIHALVVVAYGKRGVEPSAEDEKAVSELADFIRTHAELVHEESGTELRHRQGDLEYAIEPFGYRDDISQPVFYHSDLKARAAIEGRAADPRGGKWRSFEPLRVVLRKDPNGGGAASCGSYFVFRKLRQDVEGFYAQAQRLAKALNRETEAKAVADGFIGREPNGKPLVDAPDLNDFDYRRAPRRPARCTLMSAKPIRATLRTAHTSTESCGVASPMGQNWSVTRTVDLCSPRADSPTRHCARPTWACCSCARRPTSKISSNTSSIDGATTPRAVPTRSMDS